MDSAGLMSFATFPGSAGPIEYFGQFVLLDWAAKGSLVLVVAWIATRLLNRSAAATRHWVWLLAFAGSLLLPAMSAWGPRLRVLPDWTAAQTVGRPVAQTAARREAIEDNVERSANGGEHRQAAVTPPAASGERVEWPNEGRSWRFWTATVWATGVAVMLARLALGSLRLARQGRAAQRIEESDWNALLHEESARLGIRRRVILLVSGGHTMPMTWGTFFPRLQLPAESAEWPSERRRIVLLHELAHIKRFDCAAQWLAHLVRAAHWFNPLVWMAFRQATLEREQACDDLVLSVGIKPSVYGEQLLAVARGLAGAGHAPIAAIAMAQTSTFEQRLHAILDKGRNRRLLSHRAIVLMLMLEMVLLLPLAALRSEDSERSTDAQAQGATAAKTESKEADSSTAQAPVSEEIMPDLEGKIWSYPLVQFARSRKTGSRFPLLSFLPLGDPWIDLAQLGLPADASIDQIAEKTERGDLYVPEPDIIRPIHGTRVAPLAVRSSPTGDKSVLLGAIAETSCEELARRVYAFAEDNPDVKQQRVTTSDAFTMVSGNGRLFVMGVFGHANDLSVQIIPIGYWPTPRFTAVRERTVSLIDSDEQGFVFFDIETGSVQKPPFPLKSLPNKAPGVELTPELIAWIDANPYDFLFHFGEQSGSRTGCGIQNIYAGQPNAWDGLAPFKIMQLFDRADAAGLVWGQIGDYSSGWDFRGDPSSVDGFRTRDQAIGAMQWSSVSTPARGVKIRYKFVVNDRPKIEAVPATEADPDPKPAAPPSEVPAPEVNAPEKNPEPSTVNGRKIHHHPLTVSGKAFDENGEPIAGATILLVATNDSPRKVLGQTTTGRDGRYEFRGAELPYYIPINEKNPYAEGTFQVFGKASGVGFAWQGMRFLFIDPRFIGEDGKPTVVPPSHGYLPSEPIDLDLTFQPARPIRGRFVDDQGRPIPDVKVNLTNCDYSDTADKDANLSFRELRDAVQQVRQALPDQVTCISDADGRFELNSVPEGIVCRLAMKHPKYGTWAICTATSDSPPKEFEGTEVRPLPIEMTRQKTRSVSVAVSYADTRKPVVGALVGAYVQLGTNNAWGESDTQGRVALKLPPGEYTMWSQPPKGADYLTVESKFVVKPTDDEQFVDLFLDRACVLVLKARDAATGAGVEGATFWYETESQPGKKWSVQSSDVTNDFPVTDANGELRAIVRPGTRRYGIGFNPLPDNYRADNEDRTTGREVTLPAGQTVTAEFLLRR